MNRRRSRVATALALSLVLTPLMATPSVGTTRPALRYWTEAGSGNATVDVHTQTGNFLIAVASTFFSATISDDAGNAWTLVPNSCYGLSMWYAQDAARTTSVTILAGGLPVAAYVFEVEGAYKPSFDVSDCRSGFGGVESPQVVPTSASDLCLGAGGYSGEDEGVDYLFPDGPPFRNLWQVDAFDFYDDRAGIVAGWTMDRDLIPVSYGVAGTIRDYDLEAAIACFHYS